LYLPKTTPNILRCPPICEYTFAAKFLEAGVADDMEGGYLSLYVGMR